MAVENGLENGLDLPENSQLGEKNGLDLPLSSQFGEKRCQKRWTEVSQDPRGAPRMPKIWQKMGQNGSQNPFSREKVALGAARV